MLAVLILLPTAALITVRQTSVQQRIAAEVTKVLSQKLNTKVSVGRLDFKFFNRLSLADVYVEDLKGDTLLYAGNLTVSLKRFSFSEKYVEVGTMSVSDVTFALNRDAAGVLNMKQVLEGLQKTQPDTTQENYRLRVNKVEAKNVNFSYVDHFAPDSTFEGCINYKNIRIRQFGIVVDNLGFDGDTMKCRLESLHARERSGLNLRQFSGRIKLAPNFIEIKNLQLQDDYSDVRAKYYRMDFDSYSDFPEYLEKIRMSGDFTDAKIDFYTISFFARNHLRKMHLPLKLTGYVHGTVSDLKGKNLDVGFGRRTNANVSFSITGLPDVHNTFFTIDVKSIVSQSRDLMSADSILLHRKNAGFADKLQRFGNMNGRVRFTGFLSNFVADGVLTTDVGTVISDLSFVPSADTAVFINGTIGTDNFDLGAVLNDTTFGRLNFYGKAVGTFKNLKSMSFNTDFDMPLIEVNGYAYRATKFKGLLTEKSFAGDLSCDDKNLKLDFHGKADFEKDKPVFDFRLQVHHADLVNLHWNRRDSISQLSMNASAKFTGKDVDDFTGDVSGNFKYTSPKGEFLGSSIVLEAKLQNNTRFISLKSEMLDANLQAKGSLVDILPTIDRVISGYVPAFSNLLIGQKKQVKNVKSEELKETDYTLWLRTKKAEGLFDILLPGFSISDTTQLSARFASDISRTRLSLHSSTVRYKNNSISNINVSSSARDSVLTLNVKVDKGNVGDVKMHNLNVDGTVQRGTIALNSSYKTLIASGRLALRAQPFKYNHDNLGVDVEFLPSKVVIGDTLWSLSQSRVRVEKNHYTIYDFKLENANQLLYANGVVSPNMNDVLSFELKNLAIAPMLHLLGSKQDLTGIISGKANINGVLSASPVFYANLRANNIYYAKKEVGNITLQSFTEAGEKDVTVQLRIERRGLDMLSVAGVVKSSGELLAKAQLNEFELNYLDPILKGVLSNIGGTLTGTLNVSGPLSNIQLNGKPQLHNGTLKVDMLNATFKTQGQVEVVNSVLKIKNFTAYDDKNKPAKFDFTLGNFTRPKKIYYSLKADASNNHVLNSTERQNEYFYGQGYVTGVVKIDGGMGGTDISVAASTEPNTQFSIPLGGRLVSQKSNFIDFVSPADEANELEEGKEKIAATKANIKVDLDFKLTPDAEILLVLNPNTGDAIKAEGSGNIKIESQPANDIFRIFGDYTILRGEYTVSVQNVISKKFKINNGGTINFNGDVNAATADIWATYSLRAPLAELFSDTTNRYKRPVPIDCKVHITGRLVAPDLKFVIDAPTVDVETRDRMQAQLNTEDNVLTQFMSLLLIGSFIQSSDAASFGQTLSGITIGELLSSQLTSLVSQFVDLNVGVNIAPSTASNPNPDWGVSLSTNITDRVSVSGSLEYQSQRSQANPNASNYFGDVDVEVMLDKSGKWRVKAFSHANDQYTEMVQGSNRYGVGVIYQQDFDNLGDLWTALFSKKKSQQNEPATEQQQPATKPEEQPMIQFESPPKSPPDTIPPTQQ